MILSVLAFWAGWEAGRLFVCSKTASGLCRPWASSPPTRSVERGCGISFELLPKGIATAKRNTIRAVGAAMSGLLIGSVAFTFAIAGITPSRWVGNLADLASPHLLVPIAFANAVVIFGVLFYRRSLRVERRRIGNGPTAGFGSPSRPVLRVAESGASPTSRISMSWASAMDFVWRADDGAAGEQKVARAIAKLDAIHTINPLDLVLITGDITDAGRAAEWAEFFDALAQYPRIARLVLALPGNHDLNVVDRANPARLDLPMSPKKRLRQIRTISALSAIQGASVHIVDRETRRLGQTLEKALEPHKAEIAAFADTGFDPPFDFSRAAVDDHVPDGQATRIRRMGWA